jgi:formate C-acetyltransferase
MCDYFSSASVPWDEFRSGRQRIHLSPKDAAVLDSIAPYWRGRTVEDRWKELRDPDDDALNRHGVYFTYNTLAGIGHLILDVERVLRRGLAGLREEAAQRREDYLASTSAPDPERLAFYDSVRISIDGVVHHARRYAAECGRLAARESAATRRAELERMAAACARVPEHPARDTFEALQCALFLLNAVATESCQISICPGRIDQWLAPFVELDLARGVPEEEIVELLEAFLLKLAHWRTFLGAVAVPLGITNELCTLTIGGLHADGSDATTVVTEMVLRAHDNLRIAHPPLALRVHAETPDSLWEAALRCLANGSGMPSFMNDDVMIPALLELGFSREDAHDYADIGCVETGTAGTSLGPVSAGFLNLAKCLELALHDGRCALTHDQLGLKTGTMATHGSFERVRAAYARQVAFAADKFNRSVSALEQAHSELRPVPLLSVLTDNAIAEGRDLVRGSSKYRYAGLQGIGFAEVADSLTAVKRLVFEEGSVSAEGLDQHLRSDFRNDERFRLRLVNRAPKYGNGDEAADGMLRWVAEGFAREVKQRRDYWGSEYTAGAWSIRLAVLLGLAVGALPNGRRSGETLTEGIRPTSGCDRDGPTSCIRSVAGIDHRLFQNGSVFNMSFTPDILAGVANRRKFRDLMETFFGMGGFQMQFNLVDASVLREAQADPERYRDLIVRVAGYCSYFVDESPQVQKQIIERTLHQV